MNCDLVMSDINQIGSIFDLREAYEATSDQEREISGLSKDINTGPEDVQVRPTDTVHTQATNTHASKRRRCRKGLPLSFHQGGVRQDIITMYDTGTYENHMTLDAAEKLGYKLDENSSHIGSFELPNGKIIRSLGRVVAQVQFASGDDAGSEVMPCWFNIFEKLAIPVLVGMTFLDFTETLTRFRSRLRDLPSRCSQQYFRLCAVGSQTNSVSCVIDGRQAQAQADTGANISLISGHYAAKNGLLRRYRCEELQLADGSIEHTSGFADVEISVQNPSSLSTTTRIVRLHVLKSLCVDVILDEDIVDDLEIFQSGIGTVLSAAPNVTALFAPIIHLRTLEKGILRGTEKIKDVISSTLRSSEKSSGPIQTSTPDLDTQQTITRILDNINALDQKENRRISQARLGKVPDHNDVLHRRYVEERRICNSILDRLGYCPAATSTS
ncbi:hypothetical protein C7974DRAFT_395038 [Boeremia exigua]|uniref:uncharacterized protein n=1 Tax=Boeremia exigua TaxID=749465 RepID=UPI001E8D7CEA|nr:uncharacterized protein C7974DRAFT_395038 [Boeremia exigua]KAH6629702.1 hypothetical protein C7974DRAFT_395038 [Boeremia exigua]